MYKIITFKLILLHILICCIVFALEVSVTVIVFVHIRYIYMHVGLLKMLEALAYFDVYIFKIKFQ